jgi:hypothetical protein
VTLATNRPKAAPLKPSRDGATIELYPAKRSVRRDPLAVTPEKRRQDREEMRRIVNGSG